MPKYTTLAVSGKNRLLRLNPDSTSVAITTFADPAGPSVAAQLTELTDRLPVTLAHWLSQRLTDSGSKLVAEPTADDFDPFAHHGGGQWLTAPAHTAPVELTRTALNVVDTANTDLPPLTPWFDLYLGRLGQLLTGQPESVRRAVRDELARLLKPYDTVPVVAHAYDRKWNDADEYFLANAALDRLSDEQLTALADTGDGYVLLEILGDNVVDDALELVGESGYLEVEFHSGQLNAWLTANRPHLAARD